LQSPALPSARRGGCGGAQQGHALAFLDVAVGMLLLGFGATAHLRRPESLTGVWLALAGLAWFAGTLGWPLVYLHRDSSFC
jgi:hypothetical protein